jgi:hypothetical protein
MFEAPTLREGLDEMHAGSSVVLASHRPVRPSQVKYIIVLAGLLIGLAFRYAFRDVTTSDTFDFLLPWYEHSRAHGVASLGQAYTNYTPFFSYLLLVATQFHGLLEPGT